MLRKLFTLFLLGFLTMPTHLEAARHHGHKQDLNNAATSRRRVQMPPPSQQDPNALTNNIYARPGGPTPEELRARSIGVVRSSVAASVINKLAETFSSTLAINNTTHFLSSVLWGFTGTHFSHLIKRHLRRPTYAVTSFLLGGALGYGALFSPEVNDEWRATIATFAVGELATGTACLLQ